VLQFASSSFDACVSEVSWRFAAAQRCMCPGAGALAGASLIETIQHQRITHATLPPAVLKTLPDGTELRPCTPSSSPARPPPPR